MKKLLYACLIALVVSSFSPVFAQEEATKATFRAERREEIKTNIMTKLKEKAYKEIDRRVASLTKLIEKINAVKRLTDAQKSEMVAQIQAEITSLTTLRAKIEADTDSATLRTDVQSIVKSYRIYVLYIPKMTIIAHADRILNFIEGDMATLTTKLQMRIDEAKAKGYNVETMTSLMNQRKAKLDDATSQANGAIAKVTPLTPDGWPGNKTELQSARDMLRIARTDVNEAQKLANQVRVALRALRPTGTPTVTPTPTP